MALAKKPELRKKYRTRSGRCIEIVHILETDEAYPFVGLITHHKNCFGLQSYNCRGDAHTDHEDDLVNDWIEPEPEPFTITELGTYITRGSNEVEVTNILPPTHEFPILGYVTDDTDMYRWKSDGRYLNTELHKDDLVAKKE